RVATHDRADRISIASPRCAADQGVVSLGEPSVASLAEPKWSDWPSRLWPVWVSFRRSDWPSQTRSLLVNPRRSDNPVYNRPEGRRHSSCFQLNARGIPWHVGPEA